MNWVATIRRGVNFGCWLREREVNVIGEDDLLLLRTARNYKLERTVNDTWVALAGRAGGAHCRRYFKYYSVQVDSAISPTEQGIACHLSHLW